MTWQCDDHFETSVVPAVYRGSYTATCDAPGSVTAAGTCIQVCPHPIVRLAAERAAARCSSLSVLAGRHSGSQNLLPESIMFGCLMPHNRWTAPSICLVTPAAPRGLRSTTATRPPGRATAGSRPPLVEPTKVSTRRIAATAAMRSRRMAAAIRCGGVGMGMGVCRWMEGGGRTIAFGNPHQWLAPGLSTAAGPSSPTSRSRVQCKTSTGRPSRVSR